MSTTSVSDSNSFCHRLLSRVAGVESQTIEIMINNGYATVHPILALDLDEDLRALDISLGQKSLIRNAIRELQTEYKKYKTRWSKDEETYLQETKQLLEESLREEKSDNRDQQKPSEELNDMNGKSDDNNSRSDEENVIENHFSLSDDNSDESKNKMTDSQSLPNKRSQSAANKKKSQSNKRAKTLEINCDQRSEESTSEKSICLRDRSKLKKKTFFEEMTVAVSPRMVAEDVNYDEFFESSEYMPGLPILETQPNIDLSPVEVPNKTSQIKIIKELMNDNCNTTNDMIVEDITLTKSCFDCQVCGSRANGTNYGVISCNGCAIFFMRAIKNQRDVSTCVESTGQCAITPDTRTRCRHCRFNACLTAGMTSLKKS